MLRNRDPLAYTLSLVASGLLVVILWVGSPLVTLAGAAVALPLFVGAFVRDRYVKSRAQRDRA